MHVEVKRNLTLYVLVAIVGVVAGFADLQTTGTPATFVASITQGRRIQLALHN